LPPSKAWTWAGRAAGLLAAFVLLKSVVAIVRHPTEYQYDLSAYYYGPLVMSLGGDPYDRTVLERIAGTGVQWFVYPPITVHLFRPLSLLPWSVTYYGWLALKLIALGALLALWRRRFIGEQQFPAFAALCVFGFGSSLLRDLNAGNISILEQLAVWVGIAALLDRKPLVFGVVVALVGQFKLLPLGLLVLLILPRPYWKQAAASVGVAGVLLGLNLLVYPDLTGRFLRSAAGFDQRGENNPATLAAVRDLFDTLPGYHTATTLADELSYLFFVTCVAGATLWGILARPRPQGDANERLTIGFICTAFGLAVPRFKLYSYLLLLVPAWLLLAGTRSRAVLAIGVIALVVSSNYVADLLPLLRGYWPLVGALVLWALYLWELRTRDVLTTPGSRSTP
jgi:hypothetical protein